MKNTDETRDSLERMLKVDRQRNTKRQQKELIAECQKMMEEYLEKKPDVADDESPGYYNVQKIGAEFKPTLEAWKSKSHKTIKKDGALDKLRKTDGASVMKVLDLMINTLTQRVTGIKESKIQKFLKKSGGFLHSKCVIKLIRYPNGVLVCFDGMHRLIMAYLCGVEEVKVNIVDHHDEGEDYQQILDRERLLIKVENEEGEKLDKGDLQRIDRTTNNLSQEELKAQDVYTREGVRFKGFGAAKTTDEYGKRKEPKYTFAESHTNMTLLLFDKKCLWYVGKKGFGSYLSICQDVWENSRVTQKWCATIKCLSLLSSDDREHFIKYLKSDDFKGHSLSYWTAKPIHQEAISTAILRMLVRFNQWYRTTYGKRVIKDEMVTPFLEAMPQEIVTHVYACLVKNVLYDEANFQKMP